jgi:hypothetical protein
MAGEPNGKPSAGAAKLARLFEPRVPSVVTRRALAKSLRVTEQAICAWVLGTSKPSNRHKLKLKRRFRIDPLDWARPPEKKKRRRRASVPAPAVEDAEPVSEPAPATAAGGEVW